MPNEEERGIYAYAIDELRCQLSYVLSSRSHELDIADAFVWHFAMAESFMPLLQQGKQEAVAIFAHSLIVFSTVNWSRWFNSWDTFLLARAWDVLDPEHRLWIQWPIEEMGWMPSDCCATRSRCWPLRKGSLSPAYSFLPRSQSSSMQACSTSTHAPSSIYGT